MAMGSCRTTLSRWWCFMLGTWALCVSFAHGQLHVIQPEGMFQQSKGWSFGTTAAWKNIKHDKIDGYLVYSEENKRKSNFCKPDYMVKPSHGETVVASQIVEKMIVIVDRGDCTFVTKAKVAQDNYGAIAVVIVDNKEKSPAEVREVTLGDDGHGNDVHIPVMMISAQDGLDLKNKLKDKKTKFVHVELDWSVPQADFVRVDYWMSSASENSLQFLKRFKEDVADKLKDRMQFKPHYNVIRMAVADPSLCYLNNAHHCTLQDIGRQIEGKQIVQEDLRQLCIWNTTAKIGKNGVSYSDSWWDYMAKLLDECPLEWSTTDKVPDERHFCKSCSERVMEKVGIKWTPVNDCMNNQGNEILSEQAKRYTWMNFGMIINGWPYKGSERSEDVLEAICRGYSPEARPSACDPSGFGADIVKYVVDRSPIILSAIFMMVIVLLCIHIGKMRTQKVLVAQVRETVMKEVRREITEYAPLAGAERR